MQIQPHPLTLTITSTPSGEAPLWVREKWVGIVLPVAQRRPEAKTVRVSGVLTGPKGLLARLVALFRGKLTVRQTGYIVNTLTAFERLARHSPEALAWWRVNTPHLFSPGRLFVFESTVGVVSESLDPAANRPA
ncbi:MAG: hypothetical protein ABIR54_24350 [Burkholderiaceae bacterium]|jgi:hypothetical protein